MRWILRCIALSLVIFSSMFSVASAEEGIRLPDLSFSGVPTPDEIKDRLAPVGRYSSKTTQVAESGQLVTDGQVSITAAAPPLTYLEVYAVRSANHSSWEFISQYQYSTVYDHGGSWMDIVTIEYGYGNNPIAQMNGAYLSQWAYQYITDSAGTIIGWIRYWNADGHQSGQFTYQNTSINSPWNTMSDWISVQ